MSDTTDPKDFKLPFAKWAGRWIAGRTLQQIADEFGVECLIAMRDWKKLPTLHPGVKEKIDQFLQLPEVEPRAVQAAFGMRATRSRRCPTARTHAEREKQAEFGY